MSLAIKAPSQIDVTGNTPPGRPISDEHHRDVNDPHLELNMTAITLVTALSIFSMGANINLGNLCEPPLTQEQCLEILDWEDMVPRLQGEANDGGIGQDTGLSEQFENRLREDRSAGSFGN